MPTNRFEIWYCDNIVSGPWPYLLLLLPLAGAYLYGQNKHRLAWYFIGAWIPLQIGISFVSNMVVTCQGDVPVPQQMETPAQQPPT
jgi:hypothetical protein